MASSRTQVPLPAWLKKLYPREMAGGRAGGKQTDAQRRSDDMTQDSNMMRALIYRGVRDVRVESRPIPACGPDDVIVRTVRAGICGSDTTAYLHGGENMMILPGREFGHEVVGYVWKKGERVTGVQEGDRVFAEPIQSVKDPSEANMAGAFSQYMKVNHACVGKTSICFPRACPMMTPC